MKVGRPDDDLAQGQGVAATAAAAALTAASICESAGCFALSSPFCDALGCGAFLLAASNGPPAAIQIKSRWRQSRSVCSGCEWEYGSHARSPGEPTRHHRRTCWLGAAVDEQDKEGMTGLMLASRNGH